MGFDLSGLKPKIEEGTTEPVIDWDKEPSEEEETQHWEALKTFRNLNTGVYFRNNIWWWHPMWTYVSENLCSKVLTEKDHERGHYNDGHEINAIKANYIADQINKAYFTGELKKAELELDRLRKAEWVRKPKKDEVVPTVPFSVENCLEFASFARNSGGFTID